MGILVNLHLPSLTRFLITIYVSIFNWMQHSRRKKKSFQSRVPWEQIGPSIRDICPYVGTKCQAKHGSWMYFRRQNKVNSLFQKKHTVLSQISIFLTLHYLPDKKTQSVVFYTRSLGATDLLSLESFISQGWKHKCQSSHNIFAPIKSSVMLLYHREREDFINLHED